VDVREAAPPLAANDAGVSVMVDEVELDGDVITLAFTVANGTGDDWHVAREGNETLLLDRRGGRYPTRAADVVARAQSVTTYRMQFAGPLGEDVDELSLKFNEGWVRSSDLDLEVRGIPVPEDQPIAFAATEGSSVALDDAVGHHPNGTSVVLRTVTVDGPVVEVTFMAVNGSRAEVRLADLRSRQPDTLLQEPGGRVLRLLPAEGNPDLSIPEGQRLSGTMRFLGPLSSDVERVTLRINTSGNPTSDSTRAPQLTFADIPVRR
jgi:hypothetical protein